MRVFITGPGRCGTVTFFQACSQITNYTSSHESVRGPKNVGLWKFPDWHIEVASNLLIGLPFLNDKYPDSKWYYLHRDMDSCVDSLRSQCGEHMENFVRQWYYFNSGTKVNRSQAAYHFYAFSLAQFWAFCPQGKILELSNLGEEFKIFWKEIGAKGNLDAALDITRRHYNTREKRGLDQWT